AGAESGRNVSPEQKANKNFRALALALDLSHVEFRPGFGLHLLQHTLERRDLGLEPRHAVGKLGVMRWIDLHRLGEGQPDLLAVSPDNVRAQRLLLLRNVEIDHVWGLYCRREGQPRAVGRDVADRAFEHGAAIVEREHATQKTFLPHGPSPLFGLLHGLVQHAADASPVRLKTLKAHPTAEIAFR